MSGPHFRDYHLLLGDHGDQVFAMTDDVAERVRKIGGTTIRSIGQISRLQRILDNDAEFVTPTDMLSELGEDEKALVLYMRAVHTLCNDAGDVATASCSRIGLTNRNAASAFSLSQHAASSGSMRRGKGTQCNFNHFRALLGNAVAISAYREGKQSFPNGTIIARLAWTYGPSDEYNRVFGRDQSFVAGAPINVQFMVKNTNKYAATGGWGFAQFKDGKPADVAVHNT